MPKPIRRHGTPRPCLGSGMCCQIAPCALAMSKGYTKLDNGREVCTMLKYDGHRYYCGAYLGEDPDVSPESVSEAVGGIGSGCGSPLFNTARDRLARGLPAKGKSA